ncbi:MAG: hypothetical protein QXR53_02590 [Candidatus Norongarragalinales archaeon]
MKTLVLGSEHLDLTNVSKDVRNEINRAKREGMFFKEIAAEEHEKRLREYRKRKGLLMPPFSITAKRTFYGLYSKEGKYCCSLALYPLDGFLHIQGVSISNDCPYYAFSYLIYKCLELSVSGKFKGLDLVGEGGWKRKWNPKEAENSLKEPRSLIGGKISSILAKIYWKLVK